VCTHHISSSLPTSECLVFVDTSRTKNNNNNNKNNSNENTTMTHCILYYIYIRNTTSGLCRSEINRKYVENNKTVSHQISTFYLRTLLDVIILLTREQMYINAYFHIYIMCPFFFFVVICQKTPSAVRPLSSNTLKQYSLVFYNDDVHLRRITMNVKITYESHFII